ncbi:unnamed protein product [Spirodela intermedia]|uniref:Uncharacterized protein n=1 Tax=Spirodela intermedia TaxID=51605 RepID=A0A7I8KGH8_SPIIN|nr:unnamed protein product [Spirodela intermedia]
MPPAADYHYQGPSLPIASLGRSLLSIGREQMHSIDAHHGGACQQEHEPDSFQKHVADLFYNLGVPCAASPASGGGRKEQLLCLSWTRRLLEAFLACQKEFRAVVLDSRGAAAISGSPVERLLAEFSERSVKALDVCNAVRDGIERLRRWRKLLEIVLVALEPSRRGVGLGQLRRAQKALAELAAAMLDEKETSPLLGLRHRSFVRHGGAGKDHHRPAASHARSHSWSVSPSWSAARQLTAIGNGLTVPRGSDAIGGGGGLAAALYAMNSLLLLVAWALVAAVPCQDRGGVHGHFSFPRSFPWAAPATLLHERIMAESKKRERQTSGGLLREIQQMEKCSLRLAELTDPSQHPLAEEKEEELKQLVAELSQVCDSLREGLDPLERLVREAFHGIVRSREESLDCLGQAGA